MFRFRPARAALGSFLLATYILLVGCGGGGGVPSTPAAQTSGGSASTSTGGSLATNPPNDATISATITVPRLTGSGSARSPQYVSGNSLTLVVYVSQPGTSGFAPIVSLYDLTSATACPGGTCNLLIPAPSGSDDLYFVTYADPFTAWTQHVGANPTPPSSLHPLDASLVAVKVVPGVNNVALVMSAIADGVATGDNAKTIALGDTTFNSASLTAPVAIATAASSAFFPGRTSGILDFYDAGNGSVPAAVPTATANPVVGPLPTGANAPTSNAPSPPPFITLTAADGTRSGLSCGSSGTSPHIGLALKAAGASTFGTSAATATVKSVLDTLGLSYLGSAGVGYVGTVTSNALGLYDGANSTDASPFTMDVVTLGAYDSNTANFNCASQTLTITSQNELDAVAVVSGGDTNPADFQITPATNAGSNSCASVAQIYTSNPSPNPGPTVAAATISQTPALTGATVLTAATAVPNASGSGTTTAPVFWVRPAAVPSAGPCVVQIARSNAGGTSFPIVNGPVYSYLQINVQGVGSTFPLVPAGTPFTNGNFATTAVTANTITTNTVTSGTAATLIPGWTALFSQFGGTDTSFGMANGSFPGAGSAALATGQQAVVLDNSTAVSQTLSVTSGTTYTFGFQAESSPGGANGTLSVYVNGSSIFTQANPPSTGLQNYSATYTAGSTGSITVEFANSSTSNGEILITNITHSP